MTTPTTQRQGETQLPRVTMMNGANDEEALGANVYRETMMSTPARIAQ